MNKILEICRLCRLGVPLFTACRVAIVKFTILDGLVIWGVLSWLAYGATVDTFAQYEYRSAQWEYALVKEKIKTLQVRQELTRLESAMLGVLNGYGIRENGYSRPCKCGEYRDGRAWYDRYADK